MPSFFSMSRFGQRHIYGFAQPDNSVGGKAAGQVAFFE